MSKYLTPRAQRHQITTQAILDAAWRMISQEGLHRLSMRAIASEVRYSPAALYEYFESKEEIIEAVRTQGIQRLQSCLQVVGQSECLVESLQEIGAAYISFAVQNPAYFRFLSATDDCLKGGSNSTSSSLLFMIVMQVIEHGVQNVVLQPQRGFGAEEMAYAVCAFIHGSAILRATNLLHEPLSFTATERTMLARLCQSI